MTIRDAYEETDYLYGDIPNMRQMELDFGEEFAMKEGSYYHAIWEFERAVDEMGWEKVLFTLQPKYRIMIQDYFSTQKEAF